MTLLVAETPPDKFVSIPIARVQFRDETFTLTDYVPPAWTAIVTSREARASNARS